MKKIFSDRIFNSVWICMLIYLCSTSLSAQCIDPISQGKPATHSPLYNETYYPAWKAVDGIISGASFNSTHSALQPWWQVDLQANNTIMHIEITNRTGCPGCNGRLKRFKVFVTASPVTSYSASGHVYLYDNPTGLVDGEVITIPNLSSSGQYVRIWADNTGYGDNYLHLAEVKVYNCNPSGTAPPTPTGLTAITASSTQINLSWTDVSDETSYTVERAPTSTGTWSVLTSTLPPNSTNYSSTALMASTTYYYRIRASNGSGDSPYSSVMFATTSGPPPAGNAWSDDDLTSPIYRTGTVHIGKTSVATGSESGFNLFVAGGVKAEKFKVELANVGGWADYVFQDDYKQLSLRKVELFIKSNKHLPGFPSEVQIIKAGGYELSSMIKKQQESIENLYLYIIELEKKIERIKILEKRIEQLEQNNNK